MSSRRRSGEWLKKLKPASCFKQKSYFQKDASRQSTTGRESNCSSRTASSATASLQGSCVVELVKRDSGGLGLVVAGGFDKQESAHISYLRPGGIAQRSDALELGDAIVGVNGVATEKLLHEELVALLKNAGRTVALQIKYDLPAISTGSEHAGFPKRMQVRLVGDRGSFGFCLRGGSHSEPQLSRPLTVTQVRPGSAADREGTLKVGDRILEIRGVNVERATLQEALMLIKCGPPELSVLVEYDVSVMEGRAVTQWPVVVDVEKMPGSELGVELGSARTTSGRRVVCVRRVQPASVADRCGALHAGDVVRSIDGTSLQHMTSLEANQLLRCSVGEHIRLEIVPQAGFDEEIVPTESVPGRRSRTSSCTRNSASSMNNHVGSSFAEHSAESSTSPHISSVNMTWPHLEKHIAEASFGVSSTPSSLTSMQKICHVEQVEVKLRRGVHGFGFCLQDNPSRDLNASPVVSKLEPGGSAEHCGLLQCGDRVVTIDGQQIDSVEQAHSLFVRQSITLLVEFDVADSVVPSTGIFSIKLCKRGIGLGLIISSPGNRKPGDAMIISQVKRASVAHRTGTIQPGDQLIAIDDVSMGNLTIEDAAQVLCNTDEIVRLKIRKDDTFAENPDPTAYVTYTVELQKQDGPLGISVSGSEEPFGPICISGLSEGGLAQKTGALHLGDRLLAINGNSLRGKTLSDAISMLQRSSSSLMLKITRKNKKPEYSEAPEKHCTCDGTPILSVDSALESWDSYMEGSRHQSPEALTVCSTGKMQTSSTPACEISAIIPCSTDCMKIQDTKLPAKCNHILKQRLVRHEAMNSTHLAQRIPEQRAPRTDSLTS